MKRWWISVVMILALVGLSDAQVQQPFTGNLYGKPYTTYIYSASPTDMMRGYLQGVIKFRVDKNGNITCGLVNGVDVAALGGGAYTFNAPLAEAGHVVSIPAATTSVSGYLTSTDWTTFNAKAAAVHAHAQVDVTGLVDALTGKAPTANPTFTGVVSVPLGAVGAPSYTFTGDANTGIYSPVANSIALAVGGERGLRVIGTAGTPNIIGGNAGNTAAAPAGIVGATIAGGGKTDSGDINYITDNYGTIGGGGKNRVGDAGSSPSDYPGGTVAGGWGNTASNAYSTVTGGWGNLASGTYSTVIGGYQNIASGHNSIAGGTKAEATHNGSIVLADSTSAVFGSAAINEFAVRAYGGVRLETASGKTTTIDGSGNVTAPGSVTGTALVYGTTDVASAIGGKAPTASPTFTGTVGLPIVNLTDNMAVTASKTVDGVDISAHTHSGAAGDAANIPESSVTNLVSDLAAKAPTTGLADNKSQVERLADYLGLTFATGETQIVELPNDEHIGYHCLHNLFVAEGKLWGITRAPVNNVNIELLRFNDLDDLTDYDKAEFPYSGLIGKISGESACYADGYIYVLFGNDATARTVISRVNCETLAWADVFDIAEAAGVAPSICTDGEYLYITKYTFNSGGDKVRKISLADYSYVSANIDTDYSNAHSIVYDDGYVYVGAKDKATSVGAVVKYDPASNTIVGYADWPAGATTPGSAILAVGDYIYQAAEGGTGQVIRTRKDLTESVGVTKDCGSLLGLVFDGTYLWADGGYYPTNLILRYDPVTGESLYKDLSAWTAGYDNTGYQPDYMATDGQRLYWHWIPAELYNWPTEHTGALVVRTTMPAMDGDRYWAAGDGTKIGELSAGGDLDLAGNIAVTAGNTVDGVDIGAHTHSGAAGDAPNIPQSSVTSLVSDLSGKAATVHAHAQSDVTNLTTDLGNKAPLASPTFTGTVQLPATSLTDNMTVTASKQIDGVDVGAHTHSGAAGDAANIPQSSVTDLTTALGGKVADTGDTMTGALGISREVGSAAGEGLTLVNPTTTTDWHWSPQLRMEAAYSSTVAAYVRQHIETQSSYSYWSLRMKHGAGAEKEVWRLRSDGLLDSELKQSANTAATRIMRYQAESQAAASSGVPVQYSPSIRLISHAWKSDATAASQVNPWDITAMPVAGTARTYPVLTFTSATNGWTPNTDRFSISENSIRIHTTRTPSSASDTGVAGEICWDANYIYVCVSSGSWRRIAWTDSSW